MELIFDNINKNYGKKSALIDFSVTLHEGIYGILGPNGAGKSTLMNLLTDNVKRSRGSILYNGTDILTLGKAFRKKVGYMPQQQGMYEEFTANQFLYYMGAIKGLKARTIKGQVDGLLEMVGLKSVANKKLGEFSGGMKQRILLVQALMGDPEVLILDEPTAGLDPEERIRIRNYISEISQNKIVLLATHVVGDIESIADEVLLIKEGRLLKMAPPLELMKSIDNKVAEIVCSPQELTLYQSKYNIGNVFQSSEGMVLRLVGDKLPEAARAINNVSLEDVYLYYLKKGGPQREESLTV